MGVGWVFVISTVAPDSYKQSNYRQVQLSVFSPYRNCSSVSLWGGIGCGGFGKREWCGGVLSRMRKKFIG